MNLNQWLTSAWLWAQATGAAPDGAVPDGAAGADAPAAANNGLLSLLGNPMMSLPILGLMFYFMFIRPESKRREQFKQMLDGMKKFDRVVTAGGIYGTVVNLHKDSEDVKLRIDETNNTRIRVTRASIARILSNDERGDTADSSSNN
ncbi:MAG: preprotein translocase subunit YajC [Planctomycetota bacterium]